MDNKEILLEAILTELKNKNILNDIEKDLITTIDSLLKKPFNVKKAQLTILHNNTKHPDIPIKICYTFNHAPNKLLPHASENELKTTLLFHAEQLCIKAGKLDTNLDFPL